MRVALLLLFGEMEWVGVVGGWVVKGEMNGIVRGEVVTWITRGQHECCCGALLEGKGRIN